MTGKSILAITIVCLTSLTIGCAGTKVKRIDPGSQTDLSGQWNDTDSRMVAEDMVKDCLSNPWYGKYSAGGKVPTVTVGEIRNKSHEHIAVETFAKDMERALINSGQVEFVANKKERIQLREEKADQMGGNASDQTMKEAGNETGADLLLIGTINTIADQEGNKQVMFYQIDLQLNDILTNKTLWIGDKKIKKFITKSRATL
jgi:penicillin-binding protein activator